METKTTNFEATEKGIISLRRDTRRLSAIMASLEEKANEWHIELSDLADEAIAEAVADHDTTPEEIAAIIWAISECAPSDARFSTSYADHKIRTF